IKAAAVADYTPMHTAEDKIKKSEKDSALELERTKDILKSLGEAKERGELHAFLCGFSMETKDMLENSKKKLEKKKIDMIAANNLKEEGAGFATDTNLLTLITKEGIERLPLVSKEEAANILLDKIVAAMQ
ncbi:MAG: phosphopantothenoylcysteine decarboxylase, partial [Lachnospiraceae bacterium]|nr:phosphopantothenoylcysteine decarboxylase [Lachnospiraceae bacterium]